MMDMKRLVVSRQPTPSQLGRVTATKPRQEVPHQPCGAESPDGKGRQRPRQHVSRGFIAHSGGRLYVRDEVAPRAHLRAHIEELRQHGKDKMPLKQLHWCCLDGRAVRKMLSAKDRKPGQRHHDSPDQGDCPQDQIRRYHPQQL
jgi:hypothetical protein